MGHLTLEQRYTIQVLLKEGLNQSLIAQKLNRDKSVIQREIKRNCDLRSGEYKADLADKSVRIDIRLRTNKFDLLMILSILQIQSISPPYEL